MNSGIETIIWAARAVVNLSAGHRELSQRRLNFRRFSRVSGSFSQHRGFDGRAKSALSVRGRAAYLLSGQPFSTLISVSVRIAIRNRSGCSDFSEGSEADSVRVRPQSRPPRSAVQQALKRQKKSRLVDEPPLAAAHRPAAFFFLSPPKHRASAWAPVMDSSSEVSVFLHRGIFTEYGTAA